jgi:iron-sulfur cluster assembly protein
MALDEPQESDVTFTDQGISFAIEKGLFNEAKPIRVDYFENLEGAGFQLTSNLPSGGCC